MSETAAARSREAIGRALRRTSSAFALAGGLVLCGMTVLVVVSVLGRALFALPVPGDFEIVGFGTAVAIFLFLPHCYMERGNVAVDIFVRHTRRGIQRAMDALASIAFALLAALFAWRMSLGLADTFTYGDISMIVGVRLWWAYPFAVASFALLTAAAVYTAVYGWDGGGDE